MGSELVPTYLDLIRPDGPKPDFSFDDDQAKRLLQNGFQIFVLPGVSVSDLKKQGAPVSTYWGGEPHFEKRTTPSTEVAIHQSKRYWFVRSAEITPFAEGAPLERKRQVISELGERLSKNVGRVKLDLPAANQAVLMALMYEMLLGEQIFPEEPKTMILTSTNADISTLYEGQYVTWRDDMIVVGGIYKWDGYPQSHVSLERAVKPFDHTSSRTNVHVMPFIFPGDYASGTDYPVVL